ncbi:MAG: PilZ domain-containing protein [Acidobacteriota bacterium]
MSREKRRNLRRHLLYYLDIVDEETGQSVGRLGDLSHEGLLLLTKTAPDLERTYRLSVMPPDVLPVGEVLSVYARCVWSRPDVNPDLGLAGFRFVYADHNAHRIIDAMMRELGFSDRHRAADAASDDEDVE